MYSIELTNTAEKQLYKLPKELQIRIVNVLERIKLRPYHFTKRKEGTEYFISRIGHYRAILAILDKEKRIIVSEIGHRKNIYD